MTTSTLPTRRTVVRAAAWTAPVVAVSATAPAYAASPCDAAHAWRLRWAGGSGGDGFSTSYPATPATAGNTRSATATITGPTGTSAMTVGLSSTTVGTDRRGANNLRVAPGYPNVGATGGTGLMLHHQGIASGRDTSRQEVVVTFGRTVHDLRFTITDIDADYGFFGGGFWDRVELTGTRTGTPTTGRTWGSTYDNVVGTGREGDPWRMRNEFTTADDNGDATGNIAVRFTAPVDGFTLTYWSARGSGDQAIWLSDLTFTARGC